MAASYPTSAKTWPTINNGDTIQAAHPNELREEVTAIEQDLLAGLPASRGGTGLTSVPASGFAPVSNGTIYVATDVSPDNEDRIIACQVFG